jgi:hypothetical protein
MAGKSEEVIFGPKNLFSTHLRHLYKLINNLKKPTQTRHKLETKSLFRLIYVF